MVRTLALHACLAIASVVVGFAVAGLAMTAMNAVLPPFDQARDEDTARNYFPAAIAYAVWATTAVVLFLLGWRWLRPTR